MWVCGQLVMSRFFLFLFFFSPVAGAAPCFLSALTFLFLALEAASETAFEDLETAGEEALSISGYA